MQIQSIKLLRTKNNSLQMFYYSDGNILLKEYQNNRFSQPKIILKDASENFSICTDSDDVPYILCSNSEGNIYFCKQDDKVWQKKMIMENTSDKNAVTKFYIYIMKDALTLIYTIPSEDGKYHYLMSLNLKGGKWTPPNKIDIIFPFQDSPFLVSQLNDDQIIIFYKTNENTISSREINLFSMQIKDAQPILQTKLSCVDMSSITVNEKTHMIFIIKGSYSSQLLYKSKTDTKITVPLVLYEGQQMDNCIAFRIKSTLWIMWYNLGQLYYMTSENQGITFSNPMKYKEDYSKKSVKIEYISKKNMDFKSIEVFVDNKNENKIQAIPQLFSEFYPVIENKPIFAASESENLREIIVKLNNKIQQLESDAKDKNNQITELSRLLSERSSEIAEINAQWYSKYNLLKQENNRIILSSKDSFSGKSVKEIQVDSEESIQLVAASEVAQVEEDDVT